MGGSRGGRVSAVALPASLQRALKNNQKVMQQQERGESAYKQQYGLKNRGAEGRRRVKALQDGVRHFLSENFAWGPVETLPPVPPSPVKHSLKPVNKTKQRRAVGVVVEATRAFRRRTQEGCGSPQPPEAGIAIFNTGTVSEWPVFHKIVKNIRLSVFKIWLLMEVQILLVSECIVNRTKILTVYEHKLSTWKLGSRLSFSSFKFLDKITVH